MMARKNTFPVLLLLQAVAMAVADWLTVAGYLAARRRMARKARDDEDSDEGKERSEDLGGPAHVAAARMPLLLCGRSSCCVSWPW